MNLKKQSRIVIVGCQGGGINAAREARRMDPHAEITVFDASPFPPYSACSIPQAVSGQISVDDLITSQPDELFSSLNIRLVSEAFVVTGDPINRWVEISLPNGSEIIEWDSLIIATGAEPRIPQAYQIPEAFGCDGSFPVMQLVRNPADALCLAQTLEALEPGSPIAIVGAGSIGISMMEAALLRGHNPFLVESGDSIMGFSKGPCFEMLVSSIISQGVDIHLNQSDSAPLFHQGVLQGVQLSTGLARASLIILACGVTPRTDLARQMGIKLGSTGAISVMETQETSHTNVFAAGDCCEAIDQITGSRIYAPLASVAARQGRIAGRNAALAARPGGKIRSENQGSDNIYPGTMRLWITRCLDLEVASVGITTGRDGIKSHSHLTRSRSPLFCPEPDMAVELFFYASTQQLVGARIVGAPGTAADRINYLGMACNQRFSLSQLAAMEMGYSPTLAPLWDPIITAARKAMKS